MVKSINELMATDVATCMPSDSIEDVARKMRNSDVGSIPVIDGDKLVGIVTDRDIVIRSVAEGNTGAKVADLMSSSLVTGKPDMSVHEAAEKMAREEIRRLPIVDNDKLVGMVALGDLAARTQFSPMAGKALKEISESPETTS